MNRTLYLDIANTLTSSELAGIRSETELSTETLTQAAEEATIDRLAETHPEELIQTNIQTTVSNSAFEPTSSSDGTLNNPDVGSRHSDDLAKDAYESRPGELEIDALISEKTGNENDRKFGPPGQDSKKPVPFDPSTFPDRSFISEKTHQALLDHFSSLPPEFTLRYAEESYRNAGGSFTLGSDDLLYFYEQICVSNKPEADTFYPEDGGVVDWCLPPPFYCLIEDCLLFYINTLFPYLKSRIYHEYLNYHGHAGYKSQSYGSNLKGPTYRGYIWSALTYSFFFSNLVFLGVWNLGNIQVVRRYWRGMMRPAQIQLIERVIRNMIREVSTLISDSSPSPSSDIDGFDERPRLIEIARVMDISGRSLIFFGSNGFRSERLELLLIKYLEEDGINEEVVRGLDAAQRLYQDDEPLPPANWLTISSVIYRIRQIYDLDRGEGSTYTAAS